MENYKYDVKSSKAEEFINDGEINDTLKYASENKTNRTLIKSIIEKARARKGLNTMPNIKPISDLRNYTEVLHDVAVGAPVFLTKNGRGRYAIVDMQDYERTQATLRLMNELAKGRKSGEEKGWLTLEAVEEHLGIVDE